MIISGFSDKQQKILHFLLKEKKGMTVEQFSRLLGISKSAIHQHLTVLERDGVITKAASLQTGGRPGTIFVLTEKGIHVFPKNYGFFATMLINLVKQKRGSKELLNYFKELGVSIAETKKGALKDKPINEKIEMTVAIMGELGYEAEVSDDKEGGGLAIEAYNCVFHDMAYSNTEVCEMDLSLLSSLLDSDIKHVSCLAKGEARCRFEVEPMDKENIQE